MKLVVSPKKIFKILISIIILIAIASVVGQYSKMYLGVKHFWIIRMFHLDSEQNIPTWFSSSLLVMCSFIIAIIALLKKHQKDKYTFQWILLSAIFAYLSIDEAISLHEKTIVPLRLFFNTGDFLHFAWVIPGAFFALIVMISYIGFFKSLPMRSRNLFFISGLIFVTGSLGMEILSGRVITMVGSRNMLYVLVTTVEEILEMTGATLFIYALLNYLSPILENVKIYIEDAQPIIEEHQLLQLRAIANERTVVTNNE